MTTTSRILPFTSAKASSTAPEPAAPAWGGESFSLNGPSPAIARLWSQLQRVAPYFRAALLTGETGTGAEFAARALHDQSPFRGKALKVLSAAAAEAYFGPGGAGSRGLVNCVVYLEELEKLSRMAQRGLLQLVRLRGSRAHCVIAFARHDLRALVSAGSFSAELATALGGLRIALPALRDRREDIPALLQRIVERTAEQMDRMEPMLGAEFVTAACEFQWPRNLDQMGEIVAWLLRNRPGYEFGKDDFDAACEAFESQPDASAQPVRMVRLEELVQEHVRAVLLACDGNKLRAAEVLGISRSTLYRMLDATAPVALLSRAG